MLPTSVKRCQEQIDRLGRLLDLLAEADAKITATGGDTRRFLRVDHLRIQLLDQRDRALEQLESQVRDLLASLD